MDVPLVSRNYILSSTNKRYLLKDGMNLIFKAEAKLLLLSLHLYPLRVNCEPLKDYMSIINTYREFVQDM
jgi:hypothetical protein